MDWDKLPLGMFMVVCDGSACGSGRNVGEHVHPEQHGNIPVALAIVQDRKRVAYVSMGAVRNIVESWNRWT